MERTRQMIELAKRIRALAQNGLTYSLSEYDTERYGELQDISDKLMSLLAAADVRSIAAAFTIENEYVTPKVDIRAVVFDEQGRILLVKEKTDGRWSLPGGWSDIGFSPKEVAVKEVKEETGLEVKPVRLLAVLDKRCHAHPPALHYVYKLFILCEITGGTFNTVFDITDKRFFDRHHLPELSEERVTGEQVDLMFAYLDQPDKETICD